MSTTLLERPAEAEVDADLVAGTELANDELLTFAERSARYLKSRGLDAAGIKSALVEHVGVGHATAAVLAQRA